MSFGRFLERNMAGGPVNPSNNPVESAARQLLIGSLARANPGAPPAAIQNLQQLRNDQLVQLGNQADQPTMGRFAGNQPPPRFRQVAQQEAPVMGPQQVPGFADYDPGNAQSPFPQYPNTPPIQQVRPGGSGQLLPQGFLDPKRDNRTKTGQHALMASRLADATGGDPRRYQEMDEQTVVVMLANEIQKVYPQMSTQDILDGGMDQLLGLSAMAARDGWKHAEAKPYDSGVNADQYRFQGGPADVPEVTATGGTAAMLGEDFDPSPPRPPFVSDINPARPGYDPTVPVINRVLTPEESAQVNEQLKLIPEQYAKDAQALYAMESNLSTIEDPEEFERAKAEYERARAAFLEKYKGYIDNPDDPKAGLSWNTLDPGNIWEGVKQLGGLALSVLDMPRQFQVDKAGDLAYQYAMGGGAIDGDTFSAQVGDFINNFVQAGSSGLATLLTAGGISPDESFYGWMKDPANADAIINAYENGYGTIYVDTDGDGVADASGSAFQGGAAVWELYVADKTGFQRGALDIAFDPTVWGTAITGGLAKGGAKLADEGAETAAVFGESVGTIAKQGIGELLQVPNKVIQAGDLPLEATVSWLRDGPFGSLSSQGQRAQQSESVENLVQEGLLAGNTSGAAGIGGAAPPPAAGPNAAPGAPPQPGYNPLPGNAPVNPNTGLPSTPPTPPQSPNFVAANYNVNPGQANTPITPSGAITQGPPPGVTAPPSGASGVAPSQVDLTVPVREEDVPVQTVGGGAVHVGDASSDIFVRPRRDNTGAVSSYDVVRKTTTPGGSTRYVPVSTGHVTQDDAIRNAQGLVISEKAAADEAAQPIIKGDDGAKITSALDNIIAEQTAPRTPDIAPERVVETPSAVVPVREDLPVQTRETRNQQLKAETQSVTQGTMSDRRLTDRVAVKTQQITNPDIRAQVQSELDAITARTDAQVNAIRQTKTSGQYYRTDAQESLAYHQAAIDQARAYQAGTGEAAPRLDPESMLIRPGNATSKEGKLLDNIERAIYGTPDQVAKAEKFIEDTYITGGTTWKTVDGKRTPSFSVADPEFGQQLLDDVRRMRQEFEELRGTPRPPELMDVPEVPNKVFQDPDRIATLSPARVNQEAMAQAGRQAAAATKPAKAKKPKPAKQAVNTGKRGQEYGGGVTSFPVGEGTLFQNASTGNMVIAKQSTQPYQFEGKWFDEGDYIVTNVDGMVLGRAKTAEKAATQAKGLVSGISPYGDIILKAERDNAARGSRFMGDPIPTGAANTQYSSGLHPYLQQAVQRGNMDMDTALALNQAIEVDMLMPNGKTAKYQVTVLDYIIDQAAQGKTIHEISEDLYAKMIDQELKLFALQQPISLVPQAEIKKGRGRGTARVIGKVPQFFRENVMYNPVSGPAATVRDAISNAFYTAGMLSGEDGARILAKEMPVLLKSYDPQKAINAATKTRQLAGMTAYDAADIEAFADAGITGGKTPIAQQLGGKAGKFVMGGTDTGERIGKSVGAILSSKAIRDRRVGIDVISRLNIHDLRLARHLGDKRLDFLRGMRQQFIKDGYQGQDLTEAMKWMSSMGGKNHGEIIFSPDDVYNRLVGIGYDRGKAEAMSRTWGRLRREADQLARKDVNDTLFSYKQTKTDAALSSVLIFNYWQSRALMNTVRVLARNPALIRLGVEMQEYFSETSDIPGLNPWVRGLLNYYSVNTWAMFMDPINAVIPYANFREMANDKGQGSAFDRAIKMVGVAPWIQAGFAAMGWGDPYQAPNMFGTTAPMAAAIAGTDLVRNYILPEWFGNEEHMGLSDSMDLPQRFSNYTIEQLNDIIMAAGIPTADTTELQDVGTSKIRQLRQIVTDMYMEEHGVTLETWDHDPETGDYTGADSMAVADILASEDEGEMHPILMAALQEQSIARAGNRLMQSMSPFGSQLVYTPAAEMQAVKSGETPASEQAVDNAYDITDVQISSNPEFTGQVKGAGGIGTEESRENYGMYNDLAYASSDELVDKYGADAVIEVMGQWYTVYGIGQMNRDDRADLADAWAKENEIDDQIAIHGDQVDQYKKDNPQYANYTDWRSERYDVADSVGIEKAVQTMKDISPAYAKYIDRLKPKDRTNPSIVFSSEAYQAWMGEKSNIYSEDDSNEGGSAAALADWMSMLTAAEEEKEKLPNLGPAIAPWSFREEDKSEKKPSTKKTYDDTPEGMAQELKDLDAENQTLMGLYDSAQAAYEAKYPNSTDQAQKSTGNAALDALMGVGDFRAPEDVINDMKKPEKPYTSGKLKDYYTWRDNMALAYPGSDTSIEAYIQFLIDNQLVEFDLTNDEDEE